MKKTKLWMLAALLTLGGSMMTASAQDFHTKKAAPKAKVFNFISQRSKAEGQRLALDGQRTKAKGRRSKGAHSNLPPKGRLLAQQNSPSSWRGLGGGWGSLLNAQKLPMRAATGELLDEHGIIVSPAEGVRKVYTRSGMNYSNDGGLQNIPQSGNVHIVECEDGTVYVRNILSSYPTGAWVKGTREGSTLTIPAKQPIFYNPDATITFSVRWGVNDGIGFSCHDSYNGGNFTFAIDDEEGTITLQNSSEEMFMGLFWDDDDAFAWQGDYETVWTYQSDFEPLPVITVTPPAGLQTETWYAKGHYRVPAGTNQVNPFSGTVTIGFDGNDVYVQGVFTAVFGQWQAMLDNTSPLNQAWIKGTIDGDQVTFSGLQQIGTMEGTTHYAVGSDGADLTDFTMTWDAEAKVLKSQNKLIDNTQTVDVSAFIWMDDLTIQIEDPNKPIETLPYANGFDTTDEWERFTVIDANYDGSSWQHYEGEASYKYNSDNQADDWLISPAIRLEAGKTYSFAIDAHCSSDAYSERVEVALFENIADLSPLSTLPAPLQTIIESTELQTEIPLTLSNKFITVSTSGYYRFGIHATSDADHASLRVDNMLVSETVLTAPAAVTDLAAVADAEKPIATVTFTAPTKSIGGEALTANLTHIDLLRDGVVITSFEDVAPGTKLTYVDDDEELTGTTYNYQVVAYNADGEGDKSDVVTVRLNYVFDIPYVADFTQDAVGGQFTMIDANDDNSRWEWDGGTRATYEYNSDNAADDYLISPALHMEAGKKYTITVDAGSAGYTERFEIVVGREASVEGLNVKVLENCEVTEEDHKEFEATFEATETGAYYVAIHAISDPDMYELWIHKVTIDFAPEGTAPAAPELAVTAGEKGALQATVTINAPEKDNDGNTLTQNITKIELYRDNSVIKEFENVTPGAVLTYTDTEVDEIGNHTYQAIPYNDSGIGTKSQKLTVYVGPDVPNIVTGVQATDQTTTVLLTWDPVTETGRNGGYVNPADVEYVIYACYPNSTYTDEEVATVKGATTCQLDFATNEGEQGFQKWYVAARNAAGESYVDEVSSALVITGAPYDLPVVEGFAGGSLHYYWDSNSHPLLFSQSSDDDGTAMALTALEAGDIFLISGKLNLKDVTNPTLLFDAAGFGVSSLSVIGSTNGGERQTLATETVTSSGYTTVKVSLNSLKNGNFAQAGLTATITNPTAVDPWGDIEEEGDALIIDNIRIVDLFAHNLGVELSAPATVQAGKTVTITATVTNWGEQPATGYTVKVLSGEDVLLQETVSDALAPFASRVFTAELATTVFDEAADLPVTVQVEYSADEKTEDNTAETTIALTVSDAAPAENLTAENTDAGVELNWSAPTSEPGEYTETFDDNNTFPTFSIGGITATEHNGSIGEWTMYDGNGSDVYSWQEAGDYENRYQPSAWMAFDIVKAGFTGEAGHSGTQVMMSMCPVPDDGGTAAAADHWLISPLLPGTEQEISFFLRAITSQYGAESFEVLASKTDNQPSSFELIESFMTDEESWTQFSVTLPEGTKYFAIRHTSTDVFGVMLDDVTFNYAGAVTSYNIYCDGQLVATVEDGVTTYTVPADQLTDGDHTFAVTAVYANGQESQPASATLTVTGIEGLLITGHGQLPADIYTTDGRLVRRQATTLSGLKGIYIINGKKTVIN
ncbi:MAG: choice-of-anchor J domain-containing protein [Prevotella sp.]|nr:choice-of-anchor J domain-containing protein [Prevotella sp.]